MVELSLHPGFKLLAKTLEGNANMLFQIEFSLKQVLRWKLGYKVFNRWYS